MLRDTVPCARQRRWLGFQWRHPRDLTGHLRTGCYSPLLRLDDLLNLQVDTHNLALDTSDPQQPLLARVTEGEPALVIGAIRLLPQETPRLRTISAVERNLR
jgi:hypothetical protein